MLVHGIYDIVHVGHDGPMVHIISCMVTMSYQLQSLSSTEYALFSWCFFCCSSLTDMARCGLVLSHGAHVMHPFSLLKHSQSCPVLIHTPNHEKWCQFPVSLAFCSDRFILKNRLHVHVIVHCAKSQSAEVHMHAQNAHEAG